MSYRYRIGQKVTVTCEIGDKHKGVIVAYVAGHNEDGIREYWLKVEGFAGQTIWDENAIVAVRK